MAISRRTGMQMGAGLALAAAVVTGLGGPAKGSRVERALDRVLPELTEAAAGIDAVPGAAVYIRIFKEDRELEVWLESADGTYRLLRSYPICDYSGDLGPKLKEGDGQSPEGFYRIRPAQMHPTSRFHLAFNLGFPNAYDRNSGRTGSYLMVHGNCVSIGCYAMTDARIEEIYSLMTLAFRAGQAAVPVHIFPFRPTHANLAAHAGSPWDKFWRALKPAYDHFQQSHRPPKVMVRGRVYLIEAGDGG